LDRRCKGEATSINLSEIRYRAVASPRPFDVLGNPPYAKLVVGGILSRRFRPVLLTAAWETRPTRNWL
jgi:hypothetical protein